MGTSTYCDQCKEKNYDVIAIVDYHSDGRDRRKDLCEKHLHEFVSHCKDKKINFNIYWIIK